VSLYVSLGTKFGMGTPINFGRGTNFNFNRGFGFGREYSIYLIPHISIPQISRLLLAIHPAIF
jgi:hypothetical protein